MENPANLKEVSITRVFNARREEIFKAFTDPKILAKWWGPKDFTNPVCEIDLKEGGSIRIDMKGSDGTVYPMGGMYHDIVEPTILVFTTTAFDDVNGKPQLEDLNTITFTEDEGTTRVVLQATVIRAEGEGAEAVEGMEEGWKQSFDRLDAIL